MYVELGASCKSKPLLCFVAVERKHFRAVSVLAAVTRGSRCCLLLLLLLLPHLYKGALAVIQRHHCKNPWHYIWGINIAKESSGTAEKSRRIPE